jgi:hypothetical protein
MAIITGIHSVSDVRATCYMPDNGNAVSTEATTTCGEKVNTTYYFHTAEKARDYFIALGGTDEMVRPKPKDTSQPDTCSYCKGGTDENVTHCPICEGSGIEPT